MGVQDVLKRNTYADSTPASWELCCRGAKGSSLDHTSAVKSNAAEPVVVPSSLAVDASPAGTEDVRYVEVDGDLVRVSSDIVVNCPEEAWPRLMRARMRFGST